MSGEGKPPETEDERRPKLGWRDYVAIAIASLQTVLLPFVILLIVMIFLAILIHTLTPQ